MRTSEEVKNAIAEYIGDTDGSSPYYTAYLDQLILYKELAEAQDAEIARLREQHTWQPIEAYPTDGWPYALAKFNGPVLEQIDISESYADPLRRLSELRNYTHWLAIPPLPQAKEKSHAHD